VIAGRELAPPGLAVDSPDYARVTGDCVTGWPSGAERVKRGVRILWSSGLRSTFVLRSADERDVANGYELCALHGRQIFRK